MVSSPYDVFICEDMEKQNLLRKNLQFPFFENNKSFQIFF